MSAAVIQEGLFDLPITLGSPKPPPPQPIDTEALAAIAFCYTATEKGNNSGIRFALPLHEAQTWCASPISRGTMHGTEWAYFYTTALNFITCHWGLKHPALDITGIEDNGQWDDRIASLGLHKIDVTEFDAVFTPLGVTVVDGAAS